MHQIEAAISRKNGFDPLNDLLAAQQSRPSHLEDINLRVLTPFQRALLVIDGTVTKFIEAFMMEPVSVIRLSQEEKQLSTGHPWLETGPGVAVIAREVVLKGAHSETIYAYAGSLIVPERLTDEQRKELGVDGEGLGRILLRRRMETFREVLWYGKESVEPTAPVLAQSGASEFFSRTYRIISNRRPLVLINEKFPLIRNPFPAHH